MHIGHVAQRVTDLDRSVDHARTALGLRLTEQSDGEALLSSNEKHHELQLIAGATAGLDHIGLEVETAEDLAEVASRADAYGARRLPTADETGLGEAIRILGPAGLVVEVYVGMQREPLSPFSHLRAGIRKLGHLTFMCEDREAMERFWREALGFRVSDTDGPITWLRCDAAHHGLAVGPRGEGNFLHHHAWEVQDVAALVQHADDLATAGLSLLWGPVRHGPGFNLSTYHVDPDNALVEVCCDLLRIDDEAAYEPVDWSDEPRALNLWGPGAPDGLLEYGVPIVSPAV